MRLSGIIAITNSNGDRASPWKIFQIFTSIKLFPPTDCSTLQFSMVFSVNFVITGYLAHFETVYYPVLWNHMKCLFEVYQCHSLFFLSCFAVLEDKLISIVALLYPSSSCDIFFVPRGRVRVLFANRIYPLLFMPLVFSTSLIG